MKIKELHLLSDNLPVTEVFYNNILGIRTHSRQKDRISFIIGNTEIFFYQSHDIHPAYHFAFDIRNNKLDEAYKWMEKRIALLPVDAKTNISKFDLWNAESFYFYDNNGNLLELIARFDVDNQSNSNFDSSSLLYASEIGIVSDSAFEKASQIKKEYGLTEFSKQADTDSFMALGDNFGLFVLVNNQRNWFPTDKLAGPYWTKIIFETSEQKRLELVENI